MFYETVSDFIVIIVLLVIVFERWIQILKDKFFEYFLLLKIRHM
jgi:hypothetical protein